MQLQFATSALTITTQTKTRIKLCSRRRFSVSLARLLQLRLMGKEGTSKSQIIRIAPFLPASVTHCFGGKLLRKFSLSAINKREAAKEENAKRAREPTKERKKGRKKQRKKVAN